MRWLSVGGLLLWAIGVGIGLTQLWAYENAPGVAAVAPADWPGATRLPRPTDRAALVVLIHPQCSCTNATLAELARLHAHVGDALDTYVLVYSPDGAEMDWVRSPLWHTAAAIDSALVIADRGGAEARLFGAATSGQTLLYDRDGRLRFSGGITGSRGHEGDNAGRAAIERIVAGERAEHPATFVFGCSLQ
jgi:hypothetical protein